MKRPVIYICSPYRGDIARNTKNAHRYCRFAIPHRADRYGPVFRRAKIRIFCTPPALAPLGLHPQGGISFAPHLLFTQFLDDSDADERNAGIVMGLEMLALCDELWAFGVPTTGMALEIDAALRMGKSVRRFDMHCREVTVHE